MPHSQKLTFYLRKANNNQHQLQKLPFLSCEEHLHKQHEFINSTQLKNSHNEHSTKDSCTATHDHKKELMKNEAVQTEDFNNDLNELSKNSCSNKTNLTNDSNNSKDDKLNGNTVEDDCCTFVTQIRLKQVIDDVDESEILPVSVNLSKDILRNVISEIVRYEKDEILLKANTQHSSLTQCHSNNVLSDRCSSPTVSGKEFTGKKSNTIESINENAEANTCIASSNTISKCNETLKNSIS